MILGLASMGFYGLVQAQAAIVQAYQNGRLERGLRGAGDVPGPGDIVGRLEIPRLGLAAVVLEGSDSGTLLVAAGHLPGTALPGDPGNVVVSAHRDTFFRELRGARAGDRVRIVTLRGTFDYQVESTMVVDPERRELLKPTRRPTLTLITCFPFEFIGAAPRRFVVRARQVDPPPRPV